MLETRTTGSDTMHTEIQMGYMFKFKHFMLCTQNMVTDMFTCIYV